MYIPRTSAESTTTTIRGSAGCPLVCSSANCLVHVAVGWSVDPIHSRGGGKATWRLGWVVARGAAPRASLRRPSCPSTCQVSCSAVRLPRIRYRDDDRAATPSLTRPVRNESPDLECRRWRGAMPAMIGQFQTLRLARCAMRDCRRAQLTFQRGLPAGAESRNYAPASPTPSPSAGIVRYMVWSYVPNLPRYVTPYQGT